MQANYQELMSEGSVVTTELGKNYCRIMHANFEMFSFFFFAFAQ